MKVSNEIGLHAIVQCIVSSVLLIAIPQVPTVVFLILPGILVIAFLIATVLEAGNRNANR